MIYFVLSAHLVGLCPVCAIVCVKKMKKKAEQFQVEQTCHHADHACLVHVVETAELSRREDRLEVSFTARLLHRSYLVIDFCDIMEEQAISTSETNQHLLQVPLR